MTMEANPVVGDAASAAPGSGSSGSSGMDRCPIDHRNMTREQLEQFAVQHPLMMAKMREQQQQQHQQLPAQPVASEPAPLGCDSTSLDVPRPTASTTTASTTVAGFASVGDVFPDSKPQPQQRFPLSTQPVVSSIPRAGVDPQTQQEYSSWVFPSPQRFFNAMKRKGWSPAEEEMVSIVSIHNTVNEQAWRQVMQFERLHASTCSAPKLLRFRGRPNDLSPKARFMSYFGYVLPFDRHDWVVDRCGKEVTYIVDFYQGQEIPGLPVAASIHIDARPAVTVGGAFDRMRLFVSQWMS